MLNVNGFYKLRFLSFTFINIKRNLNKNKVSY